MEPPVNNQQLAQQIYARIVDYNDTEITDNDWDPVEDRLFTCTVTWFRGWIEGKINANPALPDWDVNPMNETPVATASQWIHHVEPNVPVTAHSFPYANNNFFLGSNLINNPVRTYTITSLHTLIRTVYDIGNQANSHTQCYLIAIGNEVIDENINGQQQQIPKNLILLCQTTHYAYPLRINGVVPNYTHYQHSYDDLMPLARSRLQAYHLLNFFGNRIADFLEEIGTDQDRLHLFTVLIANYICESNRNWIHLLICLLDLADERPICTDYGTNDCHFVMLGGSWRNRWSWGGGMNPIIDGNHNVADGRKIKRALVKWVIRHSLDVGVSKDTWLWWIKIHLDRPDYEPTGGPMGDKLREKLNQLFPNEQE